MPVYDPETGFHGDVGNILRTPCSSIPSQVDVDFMRESGPQLSNCTHELLMTISGPAWHG